MNYPLLLTIVGFVFIFAGLFFGYYRGGGGGKYVALFVVIQFAALLLAIVGVPICAALALVKLSALGALRPPAPQLWHWPRWAWIWDNDEDGVDPDWYRAAHPTWSPPFREFMWTAIRNPVNNLRRVSGVSAKGRPLWRKTWGATPGGWYAQAGWNSSGFPVLSAGRNVNPW